MEKNKDKKPILAICYDFDKTLSPDDMQAQGYIQSIDYEVPEFWKESNQLAADNDMDQNLAYMYMMSQKSQGKVLFTRKTLEADGAKVQLFPGVDTWFDRINEYGVVVWPAQVVNYTNKTQFLFRIEKGVLDVNDQKVNAYFEPDEYRVPFRNMVYIGDSDTDIPCMKLVNLHGGHSSRILIPIRTFEDWLYSGAVL